MQGVNFQTRVICQGEEIGELRQRSRFLESVLLERSAVFDDDGRIENLVESMDAQGEIPEVRLHLDELSAIGCGNQEIGHIKQGTRELFFVP